MFNAHCDVEGIAALGEFFKLLEHTVSQLCEYEGSIFLDTVVCRLAASRSLLAWGLSPSAE